MEINITIYFILLFSILFNTSYGETHPNDLKILQNFKKGLKNPEILQWPNNDTDPCGPPSWNHVVCSYGRVTKILASNLGLKGSLPSDINQLSELQNLNLQNNYLTEMLPSLSGLSNLHYVFLGYNAFHTIPFDFFNGLNNIQVVSLDKNPLNASNGWSFPMVLKNFDHLRSLSLINCNLVGPLPDFLGELPSLSTLKLSSNKIYGEIPFSCNKSPIQILLLNDQQGSGMSGSIDVIASMSFLKQVWLQRNKFTGTIPSGIGHLTFLQELKLSGNRFVGLIPESLENMQLQTLTLDDNKFMGPIPIFKAAKVSYHSNKFCQTKAGVNCSSEVNILLDFLKHFNYPSFLVSRWAGNNPCGGQWFGLVCINSNILRIILPEKKLNGTLSPSLAQLLSLDVIKLSNNNISGRVPSSFTKLKSLKSLDLSLNNLEPPLPNFNDGVMVNISDNPLFINQTQKCPVSSRSQPPSSSRSSSSNKFKTVGIVAGVVVFVFVALLVIIYLIRQYCLKIETSIDGSSSVVELNLVKAQYPLAISIEVLRKATNSFATENELGHGGFGSVYKGELQDGTKIAVKRMEGGGSSKKKLVDFKAEIDVLSMVRHQNLVSLLGYCTQDNECLLVYEYLPLGTLSRHLFHSKDLKLDPLSWSQRLTIALDVARGLQYLHSLSGQIVIHRDLKCSNILLGNNFRAKVSDFGLARLALDHDKSISTIPAGTYGYMAPECDVGKVTTKSDVYSFGVVLMELVTGLKSLDSSREDKYHIAELFCEISNRQIKEFDRHSGSNK